MRLAFGHVRGPRQTLTSIIIITTVVGEHYKLCKKCYSNTLRETETREGNKLCDKNALILLHFPEHVHIHQGNI